MQPSAYNVRIMVYNVTKNFTTMLQIIALLNRGFQSSSTLTPEFKSFSTKFKNAITKEILAVGAKLVSFNRNHFECSGFFKTADGQHFYFRLGDVRMWNEGDMVFGRVLMRTAAHEKDYTGGKNNFVTLQSGMLTKWFTKYSPQHIPKVSMSAKMNQIINDQKS